MGAQDQGVVVGRWTVIPRTLCLITNSDDLLLMKRGLHKRAFPGRYNGIGGHIERDEDPLTSARREIQEETGLIVRDLRLRGINNIDAKQEVGIMLLIFTAISDSRDVIDSDEGSLHWIPLSQALHGDLPLVEDLPILLPRLFGEKASFAPYYAHCHYDEADQFIMTFVDGI